MDEVTQNLVVVVVLFLLVCIFSYKLSAYENAWTGEPYCQVSIVKEIEDE